jgi:RNA polymerase sigma-70 factor (ECF subfamily)
VPENVTVSRTAFSGEETALSDEALVAGVAIGDPSAMVVFVHRFEPRVYGLALRVVGDSGLAEEVTQDAFVRVWRRASTFDPRRGRVASWLLTITRNLAVDAVRLRRDHPIDLELVAVLADVAPEPGYQMDAKLETELHALPADQARAVVLSAYYGFTAKEVADVEGIPLGTAKTRLRRGLARLRAAMSVSRQPATPRPAPAPAPRTSPGR